MEAYKKQNGISPQENISKFKMNMNSHLIPNKAQVRSHADPNAGQNFTINKDLKYA